MPDKPAIKTFPPLAKEESCLSWTHRGGGKLCIKSSVGNWSVSTHCWKIMGHYLELRCVDSPVKNEYWITSWKLECINSVMKILYMYWVTSWNWEVFTDVFFFTPCSSISNLYDSHHYSVRKPCRAVGKSTTISRLLQIFPFTSEKEASMSFTWNHSDRIDSRGIALRQRPEWRNSFCVDSLVKVKVGHWLTGHSWALAHSLQ